MKNLKHDSKFERLQGPAQAASTGDQHQVKYTPRTEGLHGLENLLKQFRLRVDER